MVDYLSRYGLKRAQLGRYLIPMPDRCLTGVAVETSQCLATNTIRGSVIAVPPHTTGKVKVYAPAVEASVHPERILATEVRGVQVQVVHDLVDRLRHDVRLLTDWLREHAPADEGKGDDAGVVGQQGEGEGPLPCPRDPDLRLGGGR
jgi:hypothetical protein